MNQTTMRAASGVIFMILATGTSPAAPSKKPEPPSLTPAGEQLLSDYAAMLKALRTEVSNALPVLDPTAEKAFLDAHRDEGPRFGKVKEGSKAKPKQVRDSGVYKDFKREKTTLGKARTILAKLDGLLGSEALDKNLVKCAVLANATPRGLATFAQQGAERKALIDSLLADQDLMKEILVAGGAKAGRYGRAMEILRDIRAASKQANDGILGRLAVATALELAAPELCSYEKIDPVRRYLAYEKWYLTKELDPTFEHLTTWECRHVINDYAGEEDLAWLRTMVRNYRPDSIATRYDRDRYMAINAEIPQTTPVYEEGLSNLHAILNAGGRCGPKATLGRAVTRSFGIPTWGARVKAHTGMTHWTPNGWTTALGVGWTGSFWTNDNPEKMFTVVFHLDQMARENPEQYLKALRCGWIGDALGQDKIDGMASGTGGFWHALALNQKRAIVTDAWPKYDGKRAPWAEDAYALISSYEKRPEENSPLVTPTIGPADRRIEVGNNGMITIPAAACVTPTASTAKILFMESDLGGIQLHYKRRGAPETFVYEVTVPAAGDYQLAAKVVTVNRGQSLQFTVNGNDQVMNLPLPYTIGMWQESGPVTVTLAEGKNTLAFTRSVPEEFGKLVWTHSGPDYGGVSIRSFTLQAK